MRILKATVIAAGVTAVCAAVAAQTATSANQTPVRLYYDYFQSMPWSVEESGPLVAICPQALFDGKTLKDADLKSVHIGSLTAVVPTTMITLNTHFIEAPNLYDGLPRQAKVLYLLTLLNDEQWRKVTGDGLTIGDCQGQQVAVMQSILPNPFTVRSVTIEGPRNVLDSPTDLPLQLSDQERQQVKLRIVSHLDLTLPLTNNRGTTYTSVEDNWVKGAKIKMLQEDGGDEFGMHIKVKSDNVPKKSQLDVQDPRLAATVPFKMGETLSELLSRITSTTVMQVFADPHFGAMKMFEKGVGASARDLIQALSLGVAGTYRRLGEAFILTFDLEGVAAHQIRIAVWEDDINRMISDRENLWRSVLAKGSALNKIRFNAGSYDKLTSAELTNLAANDQNPNETAYVDTGNASEAIRLAIQESGSKDVDRTRVGINTGERFELVLPDGTKPWGLGGLGARTQFKPNVSVWQPPMPDPVPLPMAVQPSLKALAFRTDSAQTVRKLAERVHQLGIGELWLDTQSPDVLKAAVESGNSAGVKVSAVIRPWRLGSGESTLDPDRTATGAAGRPFAENKLNYASLQKFWQSKGAFEPPTELSISPLDSSVPDRWAHALTLASVKGILGVSILDAYPIGYSKKTSNMTGDPFYGGAMDSFLSYGYSDAQRIAFFQSDHADPVDIQIGINTRVSFYDVWGMAMPGGPSYDKWQAAKGTWIHDALFKLMTELSSVGQPLMISAQLPTAHLPPYGKTFLSVWKPGSDLPVGEVDFEGFSVANGSDLAVIEIEDSSDADQINRVAASVMDQIQKSGKPVVLDFSGVPPRKLDQILKAWLKK